MQHTIDEVVELLLAAGIPAGPINTIDRVVKDPHIISREMFVKTIHPVAGEITLTGSQLKFTNRKATIRTPAPLLSQHTEEVLCEKLGMTKEQVAQLAKDGVL